MLLLNTIALSFLSRPLGCFVLYLDKPKVSYHSCPFIVFSIVKFVMHDSSKNGGSGRHMEILCSVEYHSYSQKD